MQHNTILLNVACVVASILHMASLSIDTENVLMSDRKLIFGDMSRIVD